MNITLANGRTVVGQRYTISQINLNGCIIKNVEGMTFAGGNKNILGMSVIKKITPITLDVVNKTIQFTCGKIQYKLKCRGCTVY